MSFGGFGISRTWWVEKHTQHHNYPNHLDPDIELPVLAFSEEQALSKRGLYRFVVKYQPFFFYLMLSLEGLGLRLASVHYMLRNKLKYPVAEPLIMAVHLALYLGLLFYLLSAWQAVLFIVVNQLFIGLYVGSTFAPNHKGMPVLDKGNRWAS